MVVFFVCECFVFVGLLSIGQVFVWFMFEFFDFIFSKFCFFEVQGIVILFCMELGYCKFFVVDIE